MSDSTNLRWPWILTRAVISYISIAYGCSGLVRVGRVIESYAKEYKAEICQYDDESIEMEDGMRCGWTRGIYKVVFS
jgi:hypothetical protein